MEILSQHQIQQISTAVQELNPNQLAWVSGYLSGLSKQIEGNRYDNFDALSNISQNNGADIQSKKSTILYASQTGNCKRIAEELHAFLVTQGVQVTLSNIFDYRTSQLKNEEKIIFVISTQGNGEPPDEALGFFKFIESKRAPNLDHVEYAILGLGDSSYEYYCEASRLLDKQLLALGATQFIDRVDADIDYEEVSAVWQKTITETFKKEQNTQNNNLLLTQVTPAQTTPWSEVNPYQAEIIELIDLTTDDSEQEVYHVELALDDPSLNYKPGDILAILPENQTDFINLIIKESGLKANEVVHLKGNDISLFDALQKKLEITKLTGKTVKEYAEITESESVKNLVSDKEKLQEFVEDSDLLDLISIYPEAIKPQQLVNILRPLISRQYSISSSLESHSDEVHVLIKPVVYTKRNRLRKGVTSNWLKDQQVGDLLPVHIKNNPSFKLPENPNDKIIMIGAGTGIAPFRSFLFSREAQGSVGNSWLFFGEQHFQSDFLYQTDWQKLIKNGTLEKFNVAFSRDQAEKIYVQHKLREEAGALYQWLLDGAYIYVCGDINNLATDVHEALVDIISEQSNKSKAQAQDWLDELQQNKRYQRDVY